MASINRRKLGLFFIVFSLALLLILGLIKAEIDQRDSFLCEAVHSNPDLEMDQCPAHTSNISWLFVVAFGIAFIFLGVGIYMVFVPLKKEEKEITNEIDLSKLSEEEKKIYELLKQNDNSMYQSDLIKETGYSKVQITRVLDRLESKKIIDRHRRGMTNIVILR